MFILNCFSVDLIILGMCANEPDPDHLVGVVDLHDQPVMIPLDIKNDPIVG